MTFPKIVTSEAIAPQILKIKFSDKSTREYNVSDFIKKHESYSPLKNFSFFKNFSVEPGGYAISWGKNIDIAEYELWRNGKIIS